MKSHNNQNNSNVVDGNDLEELIPISNETHGKEELPSEWSYSAETVSRDSDTSVATDDESNDVADNQNQGSYKILCSDEISKCQDDAVQTVSSLLAVSKAISIILLLHCYWNVQTVTDRWFENTKSFREEIGLFEKKIVIIEGESSRKRICDKCSGAIREHVSHDGYCGHNFCFTCWQDYIGKSLTDNRVALRCPKPSCNAAVNPDIISQVASKADLNLYNNNFLRSYLSDDNKGKWCPTPGCNHGVVLESGASVLKFTCKCLYSFCYKCLKESHQPLSCEMAENWGSEAINQSQNWLIFCSKNCPKCGQFMEVKGDQSIHICPEAKLKEVAEVERDRINYSNALIRYQTYLTQWNNLNNDQERLLTKLRKMQHQELKVLADKQGISPAEVSFVTDAWLQVVECKRVFKWATVYDYYYLKFQADQNLMYKTLTSKGVFVMEELSKCVIDLKMFIGKDVASTSLFEDFRERLIFKSRVARNYFENMVIAIRNGYTDLVDFQQGIVCSGEVNVRKSETTGESRSSATELKSEESTSGSSASCPHCDFPKDKSATFCIMCYH